MSTIEQKKTAWESILFICEHSEYIDIVKCGMLSSSPYTYKIYFTTNKSNQGNEPPKDLIDIVLLLDNNNISKQYKFEPNGGFSYIIEDNDLSL